MGEEDLVVLLSSAACSIFAPRLRNSSGLDFTFLKKKCYKKLGSTRPYKIPDFPLGQKTSDGGTIMERLDDYLCKSYTFGTCNV